MSMSYKCSVISRKGHCLFFALIFTVSVFIQCLIFNWQAFHSLYWSSLFSRPVWFWAFYLPKISAALFMGGLCLLFKNRRWTLFVSVLVSLWAFAELIYWRSNSIFFDPFSFTMIGNMNGFWSSVIAFVRPGDFLILAVSALFVLAFFTCFRDKKSGGKNVCGNSMPVIGVLVVVLSVSLQIAAALCLYAVKNPDCRNPGYEEEEPISYNPFTEAGAFPFWGYTSIQYISQTSLVHAFVYNAVGLISMPFNSDSCKMTDEDILKVEKVVNKNAIPIEPFAPLIIILYESLESWAVNPCVMPNLYRFIDSHESVLFARNMARQTRGGGSSDGQMIVNTGMLPIAEGAAAFRFPDSTYPSLSRLFDRAALIQPGDLGIWNQKRMSDAYQIDTNYVIPSSDDKETMACLQNITSKYSYVMAITMATHSPFVTWSEASPAPLDIAVPEKMRNYINCAHYSDSCMKTFFESIDSDPELSMATIVITSDHPAFDSTTREEFHTLCSEEGIDYSFFPNGAAFIMYSPMVSQKTIIDEQTFQMDVYPTVLSAIGCGSSLFRGFGKDLLNPSSARPFDELDAFSLSDKMIRSDYFSQYY